MINCLRCLVIVSSFLLFNDGFSFSEQPKVVKGIYLCTKDVDRPASCVISERVNNSFVDDVNFLPLEGVTQSGEKHQFGRHCFMLLARNNGIVIDPDGTKRLNLTKIHSYGFGKENGVTAAYEEKIVGLPKNMAISCTELINENDLTEEKINQEVAIIKKGIPNTYTCSNGNCDDKNLKVIAASALMSKMWNDITMKIDLETLVPYDLGVHNCCTVAYMAAGTLFNGDVNRVIAKVDPTTFNIYGMGVVWNNYLLSSSWALAELATCFSGSSSLSEKELLTTSSAVANTSSSSSCISKENSTENEKRNDL